MSSSNCCFLICIQISQEADGSVIPISLRIFQFVVIHTVKGLGIVNKAEIDAFLELSCFSHDPVDISNLISGIQLIYFLDNLQSSVQRLPSQRTHLLKSLWAMLC